MLSIAAVQLIVSKGDEEKKKNARRKFTNAIFGMIFFGVLEGWVNAVASRDIVSQTGTILGGIANLMLYFAGPVAIFMIVYAGWQIITANGQEEKLKKGKRLLVYIFV